MAALALIDTHIHLGAADFDNDRSQVVARALESGVSAMICIGAGYGKVSAARALEIADQYDCVHASVGLHPNDASEPFDTAFLEDLAAHPKVVAIGETGLDFYRDHAARSDQERWFRAQTRLAVSLKKPLIIHSRDAGQDCLAILESEDAAQAGGVFHCYAEDAAFAERLAAINFLVSFPGSLTFKKAEKMREAAAKIPVSQIMLETDAPFLAPEPYRGKRCESSFMLETAKRLAAIKGVTLEELSKKTSANAKRLFKI